MGSDDLAIDNVVVNNTTTTTTSVTTTTTTADTTDNDWTATYTENGAAVSIADIDSSIFDIDSANMASAAITLTNPTTGDRLLVNGSAAASGTLGSGIAWIRTDTSVTLSGVFTKAQYADAIELVQFENTTETPSTTPRIINVTVNDGALDSNVAVATINVIAVNDAPVNTVPGVQNVNEDTALPIAGISVNTPDKVTDVYGECGYYAHQPGHWRSFVGQRVVCCQRYFGKWHSLDAYRHICPVVVGRISRSNSCCN